MPKESKLTEVKKRIEKLDTEKIETKIIGVETVEKSWQGKEVKLIKITIDAPRRIPDVRDLIKDWKEVEETYEYSISFYRRYLIDKQIEPMNWIEVEGKEINSEYQVDRTIQAISVKPIKIEKNITFKILAFDTEWVEENGKSKLIMISFVSNDGFKKVLTPYELDKIDYAEPVKDEKELIERFLEIIREKDPDFLCSYNGDQFDIPKLKDRASELKLSLKLGRDSAPVYVVRRGRISSARIKGRIHIDLFDFVDHILSASMRSEVLTLDEVSQELIGTGKKEMKYKEMVEIWSKKEKIERLVEYCLCDSELTLKLGEYILPQIFAISKLSGLTPFDACRNTYSQLVESFLMRRAFIDNILIPNQPKQEEIEERRMQPAYKGATVIEPKKGIHENILVFDFRSLYPTIIVSHNISPETFEFKPCKKKIEVPESKWHFCGDNKGFIPKHLEELIERRKRIKQEMKSLKKDSEKYHLLDNEQYALKILANATYGYMAYFGARWFKRECGSSAASFGRYYISKVIELAKKEGFEIVYGDTDSLMIKSPEKASVDNIKTIGESFVEKVNKELPGIIELEFRNLYEGGIFVTRGKGEIGAKKRYALIDYKGNLEVRGFEAVRRDWCELSKNIQRQVLTIILREKNPVKAIELVRETIKKIKERKVSLDELIIYEQITRPLSEYEQMGPHVKAAQKLRDKGIPVGEGMVISFVIVKGSGSISDRATPVEFVKPNQYDPEYYIHHQVLPASMRVLKALGYSEQDVVSGKIQKKLEGFLKK
jgi:DNA polymerase I/DNA polymerase-2